MNFISLLFYIFSSVLVLSAITAITTRKMVHAVLFLILAFFNAAALFVLLKAEFLAMLLVVVYVGAIAVLFLFVVMMLDIDHLSIKKTINKSLPILVLIAFILFLEICLFATLSTQANTVTLSTLPIASNVSNVKAIGDVLYTRFALPFQLAGGVLFVAMIGAIVLTLKEEMRFIKKQNIGEQVARTKANSLKVVKVETGKGIAL